MVVFYFEPQPPRAASQLLLLLQRQTLMKADLLPRATEHIAQGGQFRCLEEFGRKGN